ncbi:MAG TPA: AAA family ATPase [Candidatus Ozemobacteraceae bacterium]|nr:AAA family ATPase [Candidatus Ozemobacteraceae bacterium]
MQLKLFEFLDANRLDMLKYASPEGALQKLGLLDRDGDIRGEVVEFLVGGRREPLTSSYFDRFKGPSLPLEKLMIVKKDVETIRTLLSNRKPKQGINILLAGPPGTGKTETVHSLAKELGLNLFEIASMQKRHDGDGDIGQSNDYFRMRALVACRYAFGDYPDTAVLIDESDSLLGGGGSRSLFGPSRSSLGKAMINDGLDTAVCPQFWIANDIDGIDPSTRRRFDYAIRYERPTPKDRVSIWETAANKHGMAGLLRPEDLERFAREWPVSAGGIDSALRNAARVPKKAMTRSEFVAYINRLIESQLLFTEEEGKAETVRAASEEQVAIEMLNIEPAANLKCILEVVARWREAPEKRGLNILLQGPPGTGKTHFARRLAELLGRPLHAKTGSEILSPYVGMTEKTIREVFRQAGRESAVLFLDEIDSLLSSREKAVRSWEVTQVNELLSALESFDGVFVAATNHVSTLDSASMRRFHFQLEFGPLTPAGAETFYRDLLAGFAGGDVPAGVAAQLRRLTGLVPSDFANVRKRLTLVPGMTATHDELLGGLADMCKARFPRRKQAIGFNNNG